MNDLTFPTGLTRGAMLQQLMDNMSDNIYFMDREGRIVLINQAGAEWLGFETPEEVLGKTDFDLFTEEHAAAAFADEQRIIQSGKPLMNIEERETRPNGSVTWVSTTKMPMRDANGKIVGLFGISRDITKIKTAEATVLDTNEKLMVALSNLKRAHDELSSVQLQLIEAEKMKSIGRLAAGVAHEVKNPLAIISVGMEYLAAQEFEDENVPVIVAETQDAVQRANTVIRGLLDFSAPKKLHIERCDLNAVIERSLVLVRGEMRDGIHKAESNLDPALEAISADAIKLGQVFVNIFTNAFHAMIDGGTLYVRTYMTQATGVGSHIGGERSEAFQAGDKVAVVEVEDEGTGIPDSTLSKVFDPFYTTKPTGHGTGLGLSVVKSILDLHRGTISIQNRASGGAKVTITLKP